MAKNFPSAKRPNTKAELREMLAEAVRNTQAEHEPSRFHGNGADVLSLPLEGSDIREIRNN